MDSDLSLINKIKENRDDESLKELINRHSGIYLEMVNRVIPDYSGIVNKHDVLLEKDFTIYCAALKYEPDRNTKFSTHLANETRWKCLNLYNKNKKMMEDPLDKIILEPFCEDFTKSIHKQELIQSILDYAKKYPDARVRKMIDMRYDSMYNKVVPWKLIAKELGMSIQGCIDIHNKFIIKAKKELNYV